MSQPDYDTTLARMAGNIAAGLADEITSGRRTPEAVSSLSVGIARAIVAQCRAPQPAAPLEGLAALLEQKIKDWRALAKKTRPTFTATNAIHEVGMSERANGLMFCADELAALLSASRPTEQ